MLQEAKEKAKSFFIKDGQRYLSGNTPDNTFNRQLDSLPIEVEQAYKRLVMTLTEDQMAKVRHGQLTAEDVAAL